MFSHPYNNKEEQNIVSYFLSQKKTILHIRKPQKNITEIYEYIKNIPAKFHNKIMIHGHLELLNEFNLKGYHCTRSYIESEGFDLSKIKIKHKNKTFSKSCHLLKDLTSVYNFDYVFFSPVFNSISKKNYYSKYSFEEINNKICKLKTPVYALGGINKENIKQIKGSNFSGVGVLGYIWKSKTPLNNLKKLIV